MLEKLHSIDVIVCPSVVTFDLGIQFDVMTSKGVCTHLGNVGNWPCRELSVTKELIELREKVLEDTTSVTIEDVLAVDVCKRLLSYYNMYNEEEWLVEGNVLDICFGNLINSIREIDCSRDKVYAYVDLEEWGDGTVKFFNEERDLNTYFVSIFGKDDRLYDDMTDEELQDTYDKAQENENGVLYMSFAPSA